MAKVKEEKEDKKAPTPNQQRLVELLIENYGAKGRGKKRRSMGSILLEAGYSPASAKNPNIILQAPVIQETMKTFVDQLDDVRRRAIGHITEKKLKGSAAYNLALIADVMTKNHQLLTGGKTDNSGIDEVAKSIRDLIKKVS